MRLLIACPECHRQYDASARPIGSRFRCHCGAVVTVQQPQGHDAAVVRCSSCGAPRQEGAASCSFCGADFTLHERDIDTICPGCFARISNRARFCHNCGLEISPESLAGEKTDLTCPVCGKSSRLTNRQVGAVALMECGRCAGFWMGANILDRLVKKAEADQPLDDFCFQPEDPRPPDIDPFKQRGPLYRKCPICGKLMSRRNYARHSGVIIDVCRQHGVWFDADELPRILAWVRAGKKAEADRREAHEAEHQKRLEAIAREAERQRERVRYGSQTWDYGPNPGSMFFDLAQMATWLFR